MLHKKSFNRLMALVVLAISFVTYWRTIAPTTSFWDCGEFITCSYILGVPHPPGAPLYLLIGRVFSMIPKWLVEDIGLRVNLISAITSAITVMLTYLIIVRLIKLWRGEPKRTEDHVILYVSGVLGSLAFAFSDTFWFNAVEAEVYAISMFLTALVVWLALVWVEKADEPGSGRYLLMIMFCLGLVLGVHLLGILALPAITLMIFFKKSKRSFNEFALGLLLSGLSFLVGMVVIKAIVLTLIFPLLKDLILSFVQLVFPTVRSLGEPGYGAAIVILFPVYVVFHLILHKIIKEFHFYTESALLVSLTALLIVTIYPGIVKGIPWLLDKASFSVLLPLLIITIASTAIFMMQERKYVTDFTILIHFGIFSSIVKRKLSPATIKTILTIVYSFIGVIALIMFFVAGNEIWSYDGAVMAAFVMVAIFVAIGFGLSKILHYQSVSLALIGLLLILVATSSYLMIYIRSGLNPAIDENNPEDTKKLVSYLNRDQYGTWSITDRKRWKPESKFTYSGQLDYLWRYQIKRMYLRYFAWQFMGKGDTYEADGYIKDTFSRRGLWWLPFLLGMLGMVYHFYKDWRMSLSVLTLFIMTGVAIVIYLNQEDPQPRERDYVYVASFFAFALWIGMGVTAVLEWVSQKFKRDEKLKQIVQGIAILVIFLAVPFKMYSFNYHSHDRTGNYVAYDYSYNILQSCEKDAILFTNGDNDTFPLWYLQYVEGIRRDVRVVNLSLLNTPWYIKQLRDEEPKVPIRLTDKQIENVMPRPWPLPGRTDSIYFEIPKDVLIKELPDIELRKPIIMDSIQSKEIGIRVTPTLRSQYGSGLRVQDLMIIEIIQANRWVKPIYFAVTVSTQNQLNLREYLRMDGLSFKVVTHPEEKISPQKIERNLNEVFRFRGLNDPNVYFNENIRGLLTNYRAGFLRLAEFYRREGEKEKMLAALDSMESKIPESVVPIDDYRLYISIGQLYKEAGRPEEFVRRLKDVGFDETMSAQNRLEIARLLIQLRDLDAASAICQSIVREDTSNQQAKMYLDFLARMLERERQNARADSVAKQVSSEDTSRGSMKRSDTLK